MKKIIIALALVSCTEANEAVKSAVDLEKQCHYLIDYATGIKASVVAKDYATGVELASKAFKQAASEDGQPCLESATYLVEEAHKYIQSEIQKNGEVN